MYISKIVHSLNSFVSLRCCFLRHYSHVSKKLTEALLEVLALSNGQVQGNIQCKCL